MGRLKQVVKKYINKNRFVKEFVYDLIGLHRRVKWLTLNHMVNNLFKKVDTPMSYQGGKKYQIHIDDVIFSLYNINKKQNVYTSIFDDPFFSIYKDIHDQYGTVFVLGLFYYQGETIIWNVPFPSNSIGFDLSQMTDKFKLEFQENSHWLKFDFHSYDYPTYYNSSERDIGRDFELVETEVVRFAGEECWLKEYAKTHGIYGTKEQVQVFLDRGYKYFEGHPYHVWVDHKWSMDTYYLNIWQHIKMFSNGCYHDPANDTLFIAGAGNLTRIIGFIPGGITDSKGNEVHMGMYEYLDNFHGSDHYYQEKVPYLSFCGHEPIMFGMVTLILNDVSKGDMITINGTTFEAVTSGAIDYQFNIGKTESDTAENLYNTIKLPGIFKFRKSNNLLALAGVSVTNPSASFTVIVASDEYVEIAKWCSDNGYEPSFFSEALMSQ